LKTKKRNTMKPTIEISDNHLLEVATMLNKLLANEYVLYTKTRGAHWNIEGINFIALHQFFQSLYEDLDTIIDDVAERVRSLGHFALGSLKDFLDITDMLEDDQAFASESQIIESLANDHETIIRMIRKVIITVTDKDKDFGTADFVTGLMKKHEKMGWMLRAHIPRL